MREKHDSPERKEPTDSIEISEVAVIIHSAISRVARPGRKLTNGTAISKTAIPSGGVDAANSRIVVQEIGPASPAQIGLPQPQVIGMATDQVPTLSKQKAHARRVVKALAGLYPDSRCALLARNPYELLVATILSAQCTDARVNLVTPTLFRAFPDARSLASGTQAEVEAVIRSTGFFRAKAKNLLAMASRVVAEHAGEIPSDLDALTQLPGVGRKTAHVVLGNAFQISSGVVVDTHVKRLSYRLGLTQHTDPVRIEHQLAGLVARKDWVLFSHRLIDHGRAVCQARKPACERCELTLLCGRHGVKSG